MAINWDIWNQGLQNRFNEIGAGQYDWSKITPDVVKGFTRYQALRPEQDVKKANKYKEILENIKNEDLNTIFGDELDEEVKQAVDWDSPDEKDSDEKWKEWRKTAAEQRNRKAMFNPSVPDAKSSPLLPESEDAGVVLGQPTEEPYESTYDRDALIEKHMRKTLGSDYDDYKRAYETYGSLNPYEQMIQAGKRSSYWDPEIGKIYTDAGEKIRNDQIQAWKEALEGESMLQKQAMDMYQKTGLSRYRREAERRLGAISNLLDNNPRNKGKWFAGYDTEKVTSPESASAYDLIEKKILNEGPMDEAALSALMNENGIKGEDKTDLLKQNQAEWKKRYGVESEVVKNTEEAIRAQSEIFKKDQTERVKNLNLLDDLRTKLASKTAGESDYRMAAETLRKLNLDISKSFDKKTAEDIEKAKTKMVEEPSFKTIGAFIVLTVGDKLGLMPGDLNAITSDESRKKLIRDAIETLYDTDLNMYENERENMEEYLKGVPGIDTSKLSWMQSRKPITPKDIEMGAVADKNGNFTITLPNGQTDFWKVDLKEAYPEFFKFFNGESSRIKLKKGTTNILTDGLWEYNIDTMDLVEL